MAADVRQTGPLAANLRRVSQDSTAVRSVRGHLAIVRQVGPHRANVRVISQRMAILCGCSPTSAACGNSLPTMAECAAPRLGILPHAPRVRRFKRFKSLRRGPSAPFDPACHATCSCSAPAEKLRAPKQTVSSTAMVPAASMKISVFQVPIAPGCDRTCRRSAA